MRQVWITRVGPPEVLELREAPDPAPKPGEVQIRVRASGINFADIMARLGLYPDSPKLPAVVGYEVAGEIAAIGDGVTRAVGEKVFAITRFGGYSDVVCVPAAQALPLSDGMTYEEAAAIPVNYLTAYQMLIQMGALKSGERVLVHSAAGGVGLAAIDLCRIHGAEVIGTASASKHGLLRERGAAHLIDYNTQDYEAEVKRLTSGRGVHIVLDAMGGEHWRKGYRCLAPDRAPRDVRLLERRDRKDALDRLAAARRVEDAVVQLSAAAADERQQGIDRRQSRPHVGPDRAAGGVAPPAPGVAK